MKYFLAFAAILVCGMSGLSFASIDTILYNYNIDVSGIQWENQCINTTDLNKTASIIFNNTIQDINQVVSCRNGCSYSMDNCRPSLFEVNLLFVAIIVITIVLISTSIWLPLAIGLPLAMINIVITLLFAVSDMFSIASGYQLILYALVMLEVCLTFVVLKFDERFKEHE